MIKLKRTAPFFAVTALLCSFFRPTQAVAADSQAAEPSGEAPGAAFSVIQNDRFEAQVSGLPGVLTAEASADANAFAAARAQAIEAARIPEAARARTTRLLRAIGALGKNTPLRQPRILAFTRNGALPTRSYSAPQAAAQTRTVTRAVSPLTYKFTGFTSAEITAYQAFRDKAYPLMTALYGDPAPSQQGRIVEVRKDTTVGDGLYELPASGQTTSGGTIRYAPLYAGNGLTAEGAMRVNEYNLLRQMLIAFHGEQIIAFDAWELGMSDAAALLVAYQLHPSSAFDPSFLGVYLLPIYDILNRPDLGNPYFFSPDTTSISMGQFRAGMAQAAWLKVWVETKGIFKLFNTAYYAAYASGGAKVAGNTPLLKSLIAKNRPTVEGLDFNDWYRRQQVLDTAITTGEKMYVVIVPQPDLTSGDTRSVFLGIAHHFRTGVSGDEATMKGGQATIRAYSETGQDITLKSAELQYDNKLLFSDDGEAEFNGQYVPVNETPVIGFAGTGTPEQARIRIVVTMLQLEVEAIFPYGVAGTVTAPSGFYGAIVNGLKGTLAISTTGRTGSATVARGAFSDAGKYPSGSSVVTTYTLTPSDGSAPKTWIRNGMWSYADNRTQSFAAILETEPGNASFTHTFNFSGDNRWRMISLPLYPQKTDEADVLGVPRTSLSLGRYRTNNAKAGFSENGIAFGIDSTRHQMYPHIEEPFAPGRGYWLKLDQNLAATFKGGEPPRNANFEVPLINGWNMIGVPFNRSFALSSLRVRFLGSTVPFADAVKAGWIGSGVWHWKPEGGYERIDSFESTSQTWLPYEGYYIFGRFARGVSLIFVPGTTANTPLPRTAITTQNWRVPIGATSATARDATAVWGVTARAPEPADRPITRPAGRPPGGPRTLTFSFFSSGYKYTDATSAGSAAGWAESLVAPDAPSITALL